MGCSVLFKPGLLGNLESPLADNGAWRAVSGASSEASVGCWSNASLTVGTKWKLLPIF